MTAAIVVAISIPSSPHRYQCSILCAHLQLLSPSFPLRHRNFIFHVSIPHLHPILLIQLSQYLRRNTCHDAVIRNITVYDCPCRYNTVFSDGHPTTDRRARTDPTSASDVDRLCILKVMETIRILLRQALIREERMESFFPADAAFFFSSTAVCG